METVERLWPFLFNGIITGALYGVVAMCFVLIYKSTRVVNFAQGEFLLVGGWICLWLTGEALPGILSWLGVADPLTSIVLLFLISFLLSLVFMFVLGVAVQVVVLRPLIGEPVISMIMVTIGLSAVFFSTIKWIFGDIGKFPPGILGQSANVSVLGAQVEVAMLYSFVIAIAIMGAFFWFFQNSRWGLAMRATAFDQQVASSLGISVRTVFALAWGISALVSAIAGIVFGAVTTVSDGLALTGIKVFPAVIVGGLDSIVGGVIGGFIIAIVENLAQYLDTEWLNWGNLYAIVPYWVLIIVLMIKPYGLFGTRDIERI